MPVPDGPSQPYKRTHTGTCTSGRFGPYPSQGETLMISGIGSSTVNWNATSTSSSQISQTEQQLFGTIDTNGSGSISNTELSSFLSKYAGSGSNQSSGSSANSLISAMDTNGDGTISLQEFE